MLSFDAPQLLFMLIVIFQIEKGSSSGQTWRRGVAKDPTPADFNLHGVMHRNHHASNLQVQRTLQIRIILLDDIEMRVEKIFVFYIHV